MKRTEQPFKGSAFSAFWRSAVLTALAIILIIIGYFTAYYLFGYF